MGIGLYDNETGKYVFQKSLDNGHWYADEEGLIYIVPTNEEGDSEIYGPDTDTMGRLNELYYSIPFDEMDIQYVAESLDLVTVPSSLRRFSEETGFYSA